MLEVVCVNWCNYQGRGNEYVERLRGMVARNLSIPHEFVCLTEADLGTDLKGWWVKLKLTQPGRFAGPVLYFDLDLLVNRSIDHLVELAATDTSKLWARDDFSYSMRRPKQGLGSDMLKLLGGPGCINSSVMLWHGDALAPVWEQWQACRDDLSQCHGDQNVISRVMGASRIGFLPDASIQSFKYGIRNGEALAPICVFHGSPKPHELPTSDPLRVLWEAA